MKTLSIIFTLLVAGVVSLQADPTSAALTGIGQNTIPAPTAYQVVSQGANNRVWERETYEQSPDGQIIAQKHSYTELATGLNYWNNGQWAASQEWIDILPNSTAAATQGQHQAYFPGDIYNGVIELLTPDGEHLNSRPVELSYFDGTNTYIIAELTNSIGVVVGNNQVIYPNAFTGLKADLRYTYTKAGFEQDVILRQQPLTPESYGLNPDSARLQVLTEFFNAPNPTITTAILPAQAGVTLSDQHLGFGTMQMIPGRAFLMGANAADTGAEVSKHWVLLQGRQFLLEEVPVDAIADKLAELPLTAMGHGPSRNMLIAARNPALPPQRLAKASSAKIMMLAQGNLPTQGFVLDYQTVNGSLTNFTFQGDMTYYISGALNLFKTNTFEGGAVLKYATNGMIEMFPGPLGNPSINWQGAAYRPVIFTAMDDNSVGDTISGSTGNPTNYYGNPMLYLVSISPTPTFTGLRMSFAKTAILFSGASGNLYGAQFVNCQSGINVGGSIVFIGNGLFANNATNFFFQGGSTITAENATFSGSACLAMASSIYSFLALTNCALANISSLTNANVTLSGSYNGFYNTPLFGSTTITSTVYPFQSVGAGNYYLTNGSSFLNTGTTNINPTVLADIATKTTYPPMLYSNTTISVATTLSPQAQRDTDTPDLGYHYDPIDYAFGGVDLYANLTLNPGTVVGWFQAGTLSSSGQGYGISLNSGANFTSLGTATAPCWVVCYHTVQEGKWTPIGWMGAVMINGNGSGATPQLNGQFTKWSGVANDSNHFRDNWDHGNGAFSNCEFYTGGMATYDMSYLYYTNCLFFRAKVYIYDQDAALTFTFQNCSFYDGVFTFARFSGQSPSFWTVKNTAFDGTAFTWADNYNGNTNYTAFDYNAYNTNNLSWQTTPFLGPPTYGTLEVVGSHDLYVTNYNWQTSWLGNFYLPSDSPLIDAGSTTADQVGLYQFTTQASQYKEYNSTVDIGYHYVAVDYYNGNPQDYDGDGIPDYLEDANGNGLVDLGETDWQSATDPGLKVWITRPRNGSTLP